MDFFHLVAAGRHHIPRDEKTAERHLNGIDDADLHIPLLCLTCVWIDPCDEPGAAAVVDYFYPHMRSPLSLHATLHGMQPDLAGIATWGKDAGVNGVYVYCQHSDGTYEGRNFNHLDPALEDSATGVAAGALTAMLGHGITLRQGRAVGSANLIRTRTDGPDILVGGLVQAG
jgi:predicted PhzF superfamily epimerase YddE/YHI9